MTVRDRQARPIESVRTEENASVERLASLLDASRDTIRRDLAHLAGLGKIRKMHGGAVMPTVLGEPAFQ